LIANGVAFEAFIGIFLPDPLTARQCQCTECTQLMDRSWVVWVCWMISKSGLATQWPLLDA